MDKGGQGEAERHQLCSRPGELERISKKCRLFAESYPLVPGWLMRGIPSNI